jgi:hypothetical protein
MEKFTGVSVVHAASVTWVIIAQKKVIFITAAVRT